MSEIWVPEDLRKLIQEAASEICDAYVVSTPRGTRYANNPAQTISIIIEQKLKERIARVEAERDASNVENIRLRLLLDDAITERDEARKDLALMTIDRDCWRGEHEGDCPYQEQTKVLREALERPVTAMEWSMARLKVGMNGIDIANEILRERAALNNGERGKG